MLRSLLFPVLLWVSGPLSVASSLQILSPVAGSQLSGTVNLSGACPGAARIDFAMGSHTFGSAFAPSFSIPWNSSEAMDGVSAIQATAYDGAGNQIASAETVITVANLGVTLAVTSPDLSETLSGTVSILLTGSDPTAFPAVWTLNIDGAQQQIVWTDNAWLNPNSVTFTLDTTQFSNGSHELHISMNSRSGPANPQWVNWRGMVNRVVQFQNGHVLQEIIPQIQGVSLAPGASVAIGCARIYTDGQRGPCAAPSYTAALPSVATVDAAGEVYGVASGFAQIAVQDGGKTSTANVWVATSSAVPHFAGNGRILHSYEPGQSLFVLAPFFLDPTAFTSPAANAQFAASGINTLSFGAYLNPRSVTASYASWQTDFSQQIAPKLAWAQANNYHLLLTGDDIFRRIGEDAWYTLNWPSGKQAVQYAVSQVASTGMAIGIEGIDEASLLWGPRPVPLGTIGGANYLYTGINCAGKNCTVNWPNNPIPSGYTFAVTGARNAALNSAAGTSFTAQNASSTGFSFTLPATVNGAFTSSNQPGLQFLWFGGNWCAGNAACSPPVPNSAFTTFRHWLASSPAVPISFPSLATDPPQVDGNWMGPGGVSDYASNYFTSLKTRTTYPWSEGIQEMISSMEQLFFSRQPFLMLDRPQLMQVSLAGPWYNKGSSSAATFNPGVDTLILPGVSPQHVSALMMDAAALGSAGLRLYYFESPVDVATRSAAPAGSSFQTGSNPTNLQTESWTAMSYASNLLGGVLQPYLLAARLNSPGYGRNLTSAARQGAAGNMLLIVNGNDWSRTINVDLTPYALGFGAAKYLVSATGVSTTMLPASQLKDSVTLSEGESVAYILPSAAANIPLIRHQLTPPSGSPAGTSVQSGYVYPALMNQWSSSKGATVCVDSNLGPFYYRFVPPAAAPSPTFEISSPGGRTVPSVF